jgi:hypothetical protein
MSKRKKPLEAVEGLYCAVPHAVLDSVAFMGAGHTARSLLFDLFRQHNSRNNGHMQLANPWLRKRGWTSNDVVHRAKLELIERGLIIQTRQGGLNAGANLYALTWLAITNFVGLDIRSKDFHPGAWRMMDNLPIIAKRAQPVASPTSKDYNSSSASRCSTAPPHGAADSRTAPPNGVKNALSHVIAAPRDGNNEYYHSPVTTITPTKHRPVVGAKGRSGKKSVIKQAR